jgi:hypothetical protein
MNPWITVLVVAAWLALIGFLVKDQFLNSGAEISTSAHIAGTESDDWFLIRIGGAYAGYGRSRQFRASDGWTLRDDLRLSLNIQGQIKPIRIASTSEVDDAFRLRSFHLKLSSGIVSFEQKGRVQGRDLVLTIPSFMGGGTKKIKLYDIPRISRSLGLPVPLTGLNIGDEMRTPIFDPMDGHKWDAVIKVQDKSEMEIGGKKIEAWLVRASYRALDLSMWIDHEGRLLKGRLPLGITVNRATKDEIEKSVGGVRDLPDMMGLSAVPVEGTIPDPQNAQQVELKIVKGLNLIHDVDPLRQKIQNDAKLTIKREEPPQATYTLPCTDEKMEAHLVSSRFIRSDHPAIIKKAKEIVGNEKDPVAAGRLINAWVHGYLKKVPTPSVPDAYAILETRQGDCNEHAVLAASLARAVGLPARISLGLVYMEGEFYYHAWCGFWGGKNWFTADPLMNQFPVDAAHVTLMHGDVDKHLNVISYLGNLSFQVLKAASSGNEG